jgi:hypothetical protein
MAVSPWSTSTPRGWIPVTSFYGNGITLLGHRRLAAGRYEVMTWITLFFVPVIPLATWVIEPLSIDGIIDGTIGSRYNFRVITRREGSARRALEIFGAGIAMALVAVIPLVIAFRTSGPNGTKKSALAVAGFLASIFWLCGVLLYHNRTTERPFETEEAAAALARTR